MENEDTLIVNWISNNGDGGGGLMKWKPIL